MQGVLLQICCQFDFKRLPGSRITCPWRVPAQHITGTNVKDRCVMLLYCSLGNCPKHWAGQYVTGSAKPSMLVQLIFNFLCIKIKLDDLNQFAWRIEDRVISYCNMHTFWSNSSPLTCICMFVDCINKYL